VKSKFSPEDSQKLARYQYDEKVHEKLSSKWLMWTIIFGMGSIGYIASVGVYGLLWLGFGEKFEVTYLTFGGFSGFFILFGAFIYSFKQRDAHENLMRENREKARALTGCEGSSALRLKMAASWGLKKS